MEVNSEKQAVRVTILSRPYTLLAPGDPREVEEVAASVNDLMLSIAAKAPHADSTRIAVLACLHLADKLRSLERDLSVLKERVDRKSEEFAGMLEQLLASPEEALAGPQSAPAAGAYSNDSATRSNGVTGEP